MPQRHMDPVLAHGPSSLTWQCMKENGGKKRDRAENVKRENAEKEKRERRGNEKRGKGENVKKDEKGKKENENVNDVPSLTRIGLPVPWMLVMTVCCPGEIVHGHHFALIIKTSLPHTHLCPYQVPIIYHLGQYPLQV